MPDEVGSRRALRPSEPSPATTSKSLVRRPFRLHGAGADADRFTPHRDKQDNEVHQLTNISVDQLNPWKRNARTHSRKQIRQIANAIKEFGFVNPVIVDTENNILAGHGRLEAAKLLGMEGVPFLVIPHMTAAQKRAYVLADNKLVLNGGYDEELLATELKELLAADLTFDIDVTGFSIPEIDSLVENLEPIEDGDPAEDRLPDPAACKPRCRPGDLWQLGPHRLVCGNSLDKSTVAMLMNGEAATMAFSDPPYNVPIAGNVGGLAAVQHREFAMASGEMTKAEFTAFLSTAVENLVAHSIDG
jgi:hypothetical protein